MQHHACSNKNPEALDRALDTSAHSRKLHAYKLDCTVTDQTTFDTGAITSYMRGIASGLGSGGPHWSARDVTETRDEDVRRIFVKFESESHGYRISVHLSVQFRALLYYKPDARVARIQEELARIEDAASGDGAEIARRGDRIISERLVQMGRGDLNPEQLFEMLYRDEPLAERMSDLIKRDADAAGLEGSVGRRQELFDELDSLLVEVYGTTAIMIDDARLVTGEDGFLYTVDIERVVGSGGSGSGDAAEAAPAREGNFDAAAIPDAAGAFLVSCLDDLFRAVRSAGGEITKESE